MNPNTFSELKKEEDLLIFFEDQLQEIYSAERLLKTVLSKMLHATGFDKLKEVFSNIISIMDKKLSRLEEVSIILDRKLQTKESPEAGELINKADAIIKSTAINTGSRDVGLVLVTHKIFRYEMNMYAVLAELSRNFRQDRITELMEESFNENVAIDSILSDFEHKL